MSDIMASMASDKVLKIGKQEYVEAPHVAVVTSKWLVKTWEYLGKPESPLTEEGGKLMAIIIAAWEELYPEDARKWYEDRRDYKKNEMSIKDQIKKHTGRSLASFPLPVFNIMGKLFPNFKLADRESCIKLISRFPVFQMANKI